jgi:hypothetical protein
MTPMSQPTEPNMENMPRLTELTAYDTPQEALKAANNQGETLDTQTHQALQVMLREGTNPNLALADGLQLAPRYYLGPINTPLDDIPRCCGPEPEMTYHDPQENWDRHVNEMAKGIQDGWTPPPLLFAAGSHMMDGNHRHEALKRAGHTHTPVIVMFNSPNEREAWVEGNHPLEEIPLLGGHVTFGLVRKENTIRRPVREGNTFSNELLTYLEEQEFPHSPRYRGQDKQGRDTLTWIEGYVLPRHQMYQPEQIIQGAQMLLALHQATKHYPDIPEGYVVLHGDPKPRNMVYTDHLGEAIAFIDFDNATIGLPEEDYTWFTWTTTLRAALQDTHPAETQIEAYKAALDGLKLTGASRAHMVVSIQNLQHQHLEEAKENLTHTNIRVRTRAEQSVDWLGKEIPWTQQLAPALRKA